MITTPRTMRLGALLFCFAACFPNSSGVLLFIFWGFVGFSNSNRFSKRALGLLGVSRIFDAWR